MSGLNTPSSPSAEISATTASFNLPIPLPGYLEANFPTDAVDSGGQGASSDTSVNLASGELTNAPPPDLTARNPVGPDAPYQRTYRSSAASHGFAAPGLSTGWFDNYNYACHTGPLGTWTSVTLNFPNGASDVFTPNLDQSGHPTGTFSHPHGAPYALVGVAGSSAGTWTSLTLHLASLYQWTFLPTSSPTAFRLDQISNPAGRFITINRGSTGAVTTVVNDAGTTLLSFSYSANLLSAVTDLNSRQVSYTFGAAAGTTCLLSISQIVPSGTMNPPLDRSYGYTELDSRPILASVTAPDLSNPGAYATQLINSDAVSGKATQVEDAESNTRAYTYGSGTTSVAVENADRTTALDWSETFGSSGAETGFTDAKGKSSQLVYGDPFNPGRPTSYSNRDAQTTNITYDDFGNVLSVKDSRSVVTSYQYDYSIIPTGLVTQIKTVGPTQTKTATNFDYYPNGFLWHAMTPQPGTSGTGAQITSRTYTYTAMGNIQTLTVPAPAAGVSLSYNYNYTSDGSFSTQEAPDRPLTMTVTTTGGSTVIPAEHYRYDIYGNLTMATDASGNTVTHNTTAATSSFEPPIHPPVRRVPAVLTPSMRTCTEADHFLRSRNITRATVWRSRRTFCKAKRGTQLEFPDPSIRPLRSKTGFTG